MLLLKHIVTIMYKGMQGLQTACGGGGDVCSPLLSLSMASDNMWLQRAA